MNRKKAIGNKIRQVRSKLGMTQLEMAKAIRHSKQSVSGYEIGDTYPSIDSLIQISRLGGVSIDWLLTGETNVPHEQPTEGLTHEEQRLIEAYRNAGRMNQVALLRIAEAVTKNKGEAGKCPT